MSTTPMTPAPPAAPAESKPKAQTEEREYIVFGNVVSTADGETETWTEIGRAKGTNADQAEDKVVDGLPTDEQSGPFVTIAARYWNPVSYELKTETKTTRKRK